MPKNIRTPQFDESKAAASTQAVFMTEDAEDAEIEEANILAGEEKIVNCYCAKDRNLNIIELLCAKCLGFFHESCIGYQLGKLVPYCTNYVFVCKNCSFSGLETFRKSQATISQMCITAIANLMQISLKEGKERVMFSKDREIIPFITQHWEALTTVPRRITQSWHTTVLRALLKDIGTHFIHQEEATEEAIDYFGLIQTDIKLIGPNYDAMNKAGALRFTEKNDQLTGTSVSKVGRQAKRKFSNDVPTGKKGRPSADTGANVKLPAHGYPTEHPYNKDGYRYILAEPDPHAPFRQEFDESSDWAGKPIPGWLYRPLVPNNVLMAMHDRAQQLKISEDRLLVTGDKGYCMARATHYVNRGCWYFEVNIDEMPEGSATRLGWGQEYANLQAPLGYDKLGYSWRSRKGTRFNMSIGKHYSEGGYGEGDVLGFLIDLPEEENTNYLPNTFKDRPLVKFKSHLYYEDKDNLPETLKNLKPLAGSKIINFKNGVSQGIAFENIYAGSYYPCVSIHKNATVSLNFGPDFKYPNILSEFNAKGLHERVEKLMSEQTIADLFYLTENEGKLRLDNL